ncbi:NAD(P)H-dependent flavin oxidoreductase [Humitalea sp. 24SJ18S-53]|uniref:NAD(P)H-dependent flavin oxidoreductase n=1 Tax=Humitalea sp. 24SJ18S-53 TaxID=3422307 RepID=UPI003D67A2FF
MRDPIFRTRITELFGIRHPILGGGLMWLSDAAYVAGIVNAGGMAFLTPRSFPEDGAFAAELERCRALTGGKPFGVNLNISKVAASNRSVIEWLDLALRAGVRHFETAGNAPGDMIARIHAGGGVVIHKCPLLRHALNAEREGADAVAIVGMEAGGHPGPAELPTMLAGALAARRLRVPLAIGGGIGTGGQILAALAVGADAVVIGSRFLAAQEVWAHPAYKARVVAADERASVVAFGGNTPMGGAWRVMDNATAREVRRREAAGAATHDAFADIIRGTESRDGCYRGGDPERGMLSLGAAAVFTEAVEPLEAIIDQLIDEAGAARRRIDGLAVEA